MVISKETSNEFEMLTNNELLDLNEDRDICRTIKLSYLIN